MSEQRMVGQVAKLLGVLVEHARFFLAFTAEDAQWVIQNPQLAINLFVGAVKNRGNAVVKKLLEFVTAVSVEAIDRFVAADHFKIDISDTAVVKFAWFGENFKADFLGKIEAASVAVDLKVSKLLFDSLDPPIIVELAGGYEITLGQFFVLLKKQGKGEDGVLLTNGWANVAYIRDIHGNLWAVDGRWNAGDGGWHVEAYSVESRDAWHAGYRFLSR